MTIDVEIDGTLRAVSVEPVDAGGRSLGPFDPVRPEPVEGRSVAQGRLQACRRFRVSLDGITRLVEVTAADASRMSLLVHDPSGANEHAARTSLDAIVAETGRPGELAIQIAGAAFQARVFGRGRGWGARRRVGRSEPGVAGTEQVRAPMPGKIARVLVAPGERVQPRQPLVVVEAMKMENELRAGAAAHVKDVLVTEGTLVEAGRVLVVLEA